MAKGQKPGDSKDDSAKKALAAKEAEQHIDVKTAESELEQDELAAFKAAKRAEEEEGLNRVIRDVTARKTASTAPVSTENFDWEAFDRKGFGEGYSSADREKMLNLYSGTVATVSNSEVVVGKVVGINNRDVILNIGFKSDGLVPLAEFKDMPNLKIGDEVDLFIEERENAMGQLVLSRRKAKLVKGWEYVQTALDKDQVIEGFVKRRTKGGLIVDVFGIEAFLPGSQIDVKPIRDFDIYVNKNIEVKVVKINYTNDNVVVSHKVLIEKDLEQQKAAILTNLDKGQVLEGVIKNMTNFGVFIDLGGVDGLLHITDISWGRISHPEEVLKLDQTVKVVVLDFDQEKKRISLGMKQLTPHPWESLPADIQVGSKVKGKIVNVADYGAFLEIQPGVEGLIHVSEMSWSQHLRNPQDFIKVGDEIEAVVLTIDREERKMSLGMKQLSEDPWTRQEILTKYAVGTVHKGIVRNLTNFGLFLELEEGIDGLVHVSDLSWTKKVKHPSEFIKVGETLEVKVLELDAANRRLALSHKHLEENPWDTFETIFTAGSVHRGTIVNKNDKGMVVELQYGIEGFCSMKNVAKQDGGKAEVGESLDFKVLEFSKEDRRISLSHKATWSTEQDEKPQPQQKKKPESKSKTIANINQQSEKSTLGDLEALSALKEKMSASKNPPAAE
ncbi:MAG: 30S ribosomal protein S1 [Bacteroidetes bacterium]|nr:30S ribosomal protein S1 [Bacteroidota bacterium]